MSAWITRKGPVSPLVTAAVAVAVAVAVVIGVFYANAPRATRVRVGDIAPDFELTRVTGGPPIRLSGNRGGPQLLVFFDSRRPGSESYFRHLELMRGRYFRRGLRIMAVAVDPDPAVVGQFVRSTGVTFAVVSDPFAAKLVSSYGTPRDPEAYFLDASGRVQAVLLERIDDTTAQVSDLLAKHLEPERLGR